MPSPLQNPFRSTIVADPWESPGPDVSDIHADVFEHCLRALEFVRSQRQSTGVLIHGEAGSGKTHLLGRLRAHVTRQVEGEGSFRYPAIFVAVRLNSSAPRIWRHLRYRLVEDFLRPLPEGQSQLRRLLLQKLATLRGDGGDLEVWWEWLQQEKSHEVEMLFERLGEEVHLEYALRTVLIRFLRGQHRADAKAFLLGEILPEEVYGRLGLLPPTDKEDDQEDAARKVVLSLCRLVGGELPIVICYDQIEALRQEPGDVAGLFAFGKMASEIRDTTSNTVQITCVISTFVDELKAALTEADAARVGAFGKYSLDLLKLDQARRLVAARAALAGSPEANAPAPPWLPTAAEIATTVGPKGCTPRKLLSFCADVFDARYLTGLRIPTTAEFLAEAWERRFEQSLGDVAAGKADAILEHGLPFVFPLFGGKAHAPPAKNRDVQLILTRGERRMQLSLCNQKLMTGVALRLRRLLEGTRQDQIPSLVILRDARLPISKTAAKTRAYLADLQRLGARLVSPSVEALAAVKTLHELFADANAGDLAHRGEAVGPATLEEWLRNHLPPALAELVDELVGVPAEPAADLALLDDLRTLVMRRRVVEVTEIARELGRPTDEVCGWIGRRRDEFGVLDGPPAVAFQRIVETAT